MAHEYQQTNGFAAFIFLWEFTVSEQCMWAPFLPIKVPFIAFSFEYVYVVNRELKILNDGQ